MTTATAPARRRLAALFARTDAPAARPDLATLADRWAAAVAEEDIRREEYFDAIEGRAAERGEAAPTIDTWDHYADLEPPCDEANERERAARDAFRDALNAIGTDAAVIGDSLYVVGPPSSRYEGGEVRRFRLADLFGERA